jgi:hypothetical protein
MTTEETRSPQPKTCPDCNRTLPPGEITLCPYCNYPLMLDRQETADAHEGTMSRQPSEPDERDATGTIKPVRVAPPAFAEGPSPAATMPCRVCGHINPQQRHRCERCGHELRERPLQPLPPPRAPPPPPPPYLPWLPPAIVVGALLLLAVAAGWATYTAFARTTGTANSSVESSNQAVITARASSTLPSKDGRYAIDNTTDGKRSTAWMSNGEPDGIGSCITLTFTFARPREIRRIWVANGNQKTPQLFDGYGRIARVIVTTDAGSWDWRLKDTTGEQPLTKTFGTTRKVSLIVCDVYPGSKHEDLAVTEITFFPPPPP